MELVMSDPDWTCVYEMTVLSEVLEFSYLTMQPQQPTLKFVPHKTNSMTPCLTFTALNTKLLFF